MTFKKELERTHALIKGFDRIIETNNKTLENYGNIPTRVLNNNAE